MSLGSKCHPLKTNMTGWKIHTWMKTRYISYWTCGFSKCHVSFQECSLINTNTSPHLCGKYISHTNGFVCTSMSLWIFQGETSNFPCLKPRCFFQVVKGGRSGPALCSRSTGSRTAEAGAVFSDSVSHGKNLKRNYRKFGDDVLRKSLGSMEKWQSPNFQNLLQFSFSLSPWCHGRIELGMSLQILWQLRFLIPDNQHLEIDCVHLVLSHQEVRFKGVDR